MFGRLRPDCTGRGFFVYDKKTPDAHSAQRKMAAGAAALRRECAPWRTLFRSQETWFPMTFVYDEKVSRETHSAQRKIAAGAAASQRG